MLESMYFGPTWNIFLSIKPSNIWWKKTRNKFHYMYIHHAVILLISVTHTKIKSLYNFLRKKLNWNEKCIGKMECGKILYISLYKLFLTWLFFFKSQTLFYHLNYMLSLHMLTAVYLYIPKCWFVLLWIIYHVHDCAAPSLK